MSIEFKRLHRFIDQIYARIVPSNDARVAAYLALGWASIIAVVYVSRVLPIRFNSVLKLQSYKPTYTQLARAKTASTELPKQAPVTQRPKEPASHVNSYTWGNCTYYVASRRAIPAHWGNASAWFTQAVNAGWETRDTPVVGAIAWTNQGKLGHVALVEAVDGSRITIAEMNYFGLGVVDKRTALAKDFRYIY